MLKNAIVQLFVAESDCPLRHVSERYFYIGDTDISLQYICGKQRPIGGICGGARYL